MAFPKKSCLTGFCNLLGAMVTLIFYHHLQTNGQAKRMNQEFDTSLHCLVSQILFPGASIWFSKNMHILLCPAPLLAYSPSNVNKETSPHCSLPWNIRWGFLLSLRWTPSSKKYKMAVDRFRAPAPSYQVNLMVWLSTLDLHLCMEYHKLDTWSIGPFPVSKLINPVVMRFKLIWSLRLHPRFHENRKSVCWSLLPVPHGPSGSLMEVWCTLWRNCCRYAVEAGADSI